MNKKWLNFHTSYSPVNISVNQGPASIIQDWHRLDWDNTYIDGVQLSKLMQEEEISKEIFNENGNEILKNFFNRKILKKYQGNDKEAFVDKLMKSFHQGGLLHPVSAGMYHVFKGEDFGPSGSENPKQVNIQTTSNGFVVQEIYTVNTCTPTINAGDNFYDRFPDGKIMPDAGHQYVVQAQATVDVSFKNDGLKIKVLNQSISYGNDYVKSIADKRSWIGKLIDFFKNLFGANAVEDLSLKNEEPEEKTLNCNYSNSV